MNPGEQRDGGTTAVPLGQKRVGWVYPGETRVRYYTGPTPAAERWLRALLACGYSAWEES